MPQTTPTPPVSTISHVELTQTSEDITWVHAKNPEAGTRLRKLYRAFCASHEMPDPTQPFYRGQQLYLIVGDTVLSMEYMEQCRASNYHILKDSSGEIPHRKHISELQKAFATNDEAWEALAKECEATASFIREKILTIPQ